MSRLLAKPPPEGDGVSLTADFERRVVLVQGSGFDYWVPMEQVRLLGSPPSKAAGASLIVASLVFGAYKLVRLGQ
jgi:hypothetical protein